MEASAFFSSIFKNLCAIKLCFLTLIVIDFTACAKSSTDGNFPYLNDSIIVIGIYSDKGAAEGCVIASENMFKWMGFTTQKIYSQDFNLKRIKNIDLFYFPGGSTGPYLTEISPSGKEYLKNLINAGHSFIGVCAGALFACEVQVWNGNSIINGQLGLFKGSGIGPIPEIFEYPEIGMCRIDLNNNHPITKNLPDSSWIMFYNGPWFEPLPNSGSTIIGRYTKTGKPSIIATSYGEGRIFLIGPHPEFEEDSDRDGIIYFKSLDDMGSDWELMQQAAQWCLKIGDN
jgi:glutamine amidotransferase-like uncharacterized protein